MKQKYKSIALLVTLTVVLLSQFAAPQRVYAATFTVTKTTDTNDGACDADCSLREAIVAANATAGADIVTLTSGLTYVLSIAGTGENVSATGDLDVTDASGLTINTSGAGTATIDANDIDRILDVRPGATLTLNNITITNGSASTNGGGMYVDGSTTITGGAFTANVTTAGSDGGAIFVNSGIVSISGTTFTNNSSTDDGGAMYLIGGTTTITGATFSGNTGSDIAGAIRIDADNTSISNTTFSNNTSNAINTPAGVGGGAIFINETADTTTVTLSTFSGNTTSRANTSRGGAIYNEGTNVVIANSTFSGNTATETVAGAAGDVAQGGAIFQDDVGAPDPTLTLYNVTFSGNSTTVTGLGTASGGSIYRNNASGSFTLANTIVANGTAGGAANNCGGSAITDGGNNIDFNGGGCGIANTANPNLGGLTGSPAYFPLNSGSPAIDTGSNAVCANAFVNNQSQNGLTRPQPAAGTCDIGSFEFTDITPPTLISFTRQTPATSPTNADTLVFRATFDEDVTNVSAGDFSVNGGTTATVTGVATVSASVYDITVSGGDLAGFNGTVGLDVAVGQDIIDLASNALPTAEPATDETYDVDNTGPLVTIGAPSVASTTTGPVDFPITITGSTSQNLLPANVTLNTTGTATGTVSVTNGATANPTVTISAITGSGTIGISIAAGVATDGLNTSPAAGPSATFIVDNGGPVVTASVPATGSSVPGPTQLTVTYNEDVQNLGAGGAANTANYLLVEAGVNTAFDTVSCLLGVAPDDVTIAIDGAAYSNGGGGGPFVATLDINGGVALPVGSYRLYVCGTTSVQDLAGNELNDGAADTLIDFTVVVAPGGGSGGGSTRASAIPATGFPQGEVTSLPLQPAEGMYTATTLWLEIPRLGVKMKIVGVPQTKDGWDVTWLNRDAGWLNGSAFPTWSGNSVITGHVWDAFNKPGPFTNLKDLKYGDQVKIHAFGQVFIYEIRESSLIAPSNVASMLKHEEKSWLTLVTCDTYNESNKTYKYRRLVRAVLISVTMEK
ncbi:MAG: sortase [Chloroflexota bacterium]